MSTSSPDDLEVNRLVLEEITSKKTLSVLNALCGGTMRFSRVHDVGRRVRHSEVRRRGLPDLPRRPGLAGAQRGPSPCPNATRGCPASLHRGDLRRPRRPAGLSGTRANAPARWCQRISAAPRRVRAKGPRRLPTGYRRRPRRAGLTAFATATGGSVGSDAMMAPTRRGCRRIASWPPCKTRTQASASI